MEQAEALKNRYICVSRTDDAVKLKKDTYFVVDLIGCETFDTNGKALGKVDGRAGGPGQTTFTRLTAESCSCPR